MKRKVISVDTGGKEGDAVVMVEATLNDDGTITVDKMKSKTAHPGEGE